MPLGQSCPQPESPLKPPWNPDVPLETSGLSLSWVTGTRCRRMLRQSSQVYRDTTDSLGINADLGGEEIISQLSYMLTVSLTEVASFLFLRGINVPLWTPWIVRAGECGGEGALLTGSLWTAHQYKHDNMHQVCPTGAWALT